SEKCLVTWMISNMNQTESDRELAYFTSYTESGKKIINYKPALIWDKMRDYHTSQSTHKWMSLRDMLDQTRQGVSRDLLKHIDDWQQKLKALLEARETISEEEMCSRLARSLNSKWRQKATNYMELGFNKLDTLITKLKRAYELQMSVNTSQIMSNNHSHCIKEHKCPECNKMTHRHMRCTPKHCDGGDHHSLEDCFKLPQNCHKLKEWEEEKKATSQ
ncbi:hypothetical protein CROQUDRAFT_43028, partial [Cronartium quercuum f. sp. fusiforme G11]